MDTIQCQGLDSGRGDGNSMVCTTGDTDSISQTTRHALFFPVGFNRGGWDELILDSRMFEDVL
jgi:hypothetical protein